MAFSTLVPFLKIEITHMKSEDCKTNLHGISTSDFEGVYGFYLVEPLLPRKISRAIGVLHTGGIRKKTRGVIYACLESPLYQQLLVLL